MIIVKPEKLTGLMPRILELTSRITPWHRRDWRAGTLELVEEVLNESRIAGTQPKALRELREHMAAAMKDDPGVTNIQRSLIRYVENIDPSSDVESHNVHLAQNHVDDLRQTYLQNWADIFDDPEKAAQLDIEGTAKRIVSHLLYCGVSAASVYKILHDRRESSEEYDFSSVLRELDDRTKHEVRDFNFAVPVDRAPDFLYPSPPHGWLNAKQLKQWKHKNAPGAETVRHHGGFILSVKARDVNEAADEAQKLLSQLSFKFRSGAENKFNIFSVMWSEEKGNIFFTRKVSSPVKLRAFERAGTLWHLQISSIARNILAIVEPLQTNDSHVAIVNGWVAIESLLVDSNENDRIGAERMARVVAASYFRTEMNWLAREYAELYKGRCPVGGQIENAVTSIERARLMERLIRNKADVSLLDPPDQLAVEKMQQALEKPSVVFDRTYKILTREFQRMYRKRNLIVHSGKALEHGIESVADKVVPLLINGIDQLLIANIQHGLDPKSFAAQIEFRALHLEENGHSRIYSLLDLLEVEEATDLK